MDVFQLTRALIDIPSVTLEEQAVAEYLAAHLRTMGAAVELDEAEPSRPNVYAAWGAPDVVLSTHIDTVPPFFASREDDVNIYGRGSCDAKGIVAAQVEAARRLRNEGIGDFALLFLVGEERNSAGAAHANKRPRGSRYIINGEPTENRLALGTKGVLRVGIEARGRMAHSAYPELGESATEKLLDALERVRRLPLPTDPVLGATTVNIGLLSGGVAPNVIPSSARAELMYRIVAPGDTLLAQVTEAAGTLAEVRRVLEIPPVKLGTIDGLADGMSTSGVGTAAEGVIVKFSTDIPCLTNWGQPFLLGPGSIHVAHTDNEHIPKAQLAEAVDIYMKMVKLLKSRKG
ncbi:MAG: M20/M25/M40 family metallo-hydrolase [Acidobacteria bacterium]|nr:M20/M25/M40 family metallo-hydrolase [Acidobacteriota bacterium]